MLDPPLNWENIGLMSVCRLLAQVWAWDVYYAYISSYFGNFSNLCIFGNLVNFGIFGNFGDFGN